MSDFYEVIGWLGNILFAISAMPQAYKSYKEKHSNGVSSGLLGLWLSGEVLTFIYTLNKGDLAPLYMNYILNIIFIGIIIYYKSKGSENGK